MLSPATTVTPGLNGHGATILAPRKFRIDVQRSPGEVRVCPIGEVDVATVGRLREQLEEVMAAGRSRLILDLRQTTFIDSAGLHAAVHVNRAAAANGTEFALFAGPPAVQRTFAVTGLCEQLPFVEPPRP
jgi:anti-sigma B factor antagonist